MSVLKFKGEVLLYLAKTVSGLSPKGEVGRGPLYSTLFGNRILLK